MLYTVYSVHGDVDSFELVGTLSAVTCFLRCRAEAEVQRRIRHEAEDDGHCRLTFNSAAYGLPGVWLVRPGIHIPDTFS